MITQKSLWSPSLFTEWIGGREIKQIMRYNLVVILEMAPKKSRRWDIRSPELVREEVAGRYLSRFSFN